MPVVVVVVVVVDTAVVVVEDKVVVVEPVFIVGMTAADSFSFSLSALSSDQYLFPERVPLKLNSLSLTEATCLTAAFL